MDLKETLVFYALITWSGSSGYGLEGKHLCSMH